MSERAQTSEHAERVAAAGVSPAATSDAIELDENMGTS
jgi:hypothetical protein